MKTLAQLGDRLLGRFVPETHAHADECVAEYRCYPASLCDSRRERQKRFVCSSGRIDPWYKVGCCA